MGNIEKANEYLAKLKSEKEYWKQKVDALPGDSVSATNPVYKMATNAANKYATAAYMFKLLAEQHTACQTEYTESNNTINKGEQM